MRTNRFDARKLSHDKLTELQKRAVAAVQNGESPANPHFPWTRWADLL